MPSPRCQDRACGDLPFELLGLAVLELPRGAFGQLLASLAFDVEFECPDRFVSCVLLEDFLFGLRELERSLFALDDLLARVDAVFDVELGEDVRRAHVILLRGEHVAEPLAGTAGAIKPALGLLHR